MDTAICLKIAYDGTDFYGWQDNGEERSVEKELRSVLELITQGRVALQAASRTDRGVHALGQIVVCELEKFPKDLRLFHKSLNSLLPEDLAVMEVSCVDKAFHPTLDSKQKEYHYLLSNHSILLPQKRRQAWHFPHAIDFEKVEKGIQKLLGTHDFKGFCNFRNDLRYKDTVRTLYSIQIKEVEKGLYKFIIIGDHFLYKMVRNLVGTLAYIGAGKLPLDVIDRLFAEKKRSLGGITAPAHGLYLFQIAYQNSDRQKQPQKALQEKG